MQNNVTYPQGAVEPVPEPTVAAKLVAFHTELLDGGLDAETVNLLVLEYADHLFKHKDTGNKKK